MAQNEGRQLKMASCHHCGNNLDSYLATKVGRQDSCSSCGRDLRVCLNCEFYDRNSHWECREEVAEQVVNKEKANFCDNFRLNQNSSGKITDAKKDILSAAEALFKKK